MKKSEVVQTVLGERQNAVPHYSSGKVFAPTNIALCKYWGKRDQEINLPLTSSLSVSLADKGATTELKINDKPKDVVVLNHQELDLTLPFCKRLFEFLNLFRGQRAHPLHIDIETNVPIAAGLASSACGFASLVVALDALFHWELSSQDLSILARIGSGSACRSLWTGFVEWHAGVQNDGMDSFGSPIEAHWPELCVGLVIIDKKEKSIPSREAMQRTVSNSALYSAWPAKVNRDLLLLKHAIQSQDFELLGQTAESNAMSMHATMQSAWPPIFYHLPETLQMMHTVWQLRNQGLSLYFTQDAGPNLKLLFLTKDIDIVRSYFPRVQVIYPFKKDVV